MEKEIRKGKRELNKGKMGEDKWRNSKCEKERRESKKEIR